MLLTNCYVFEPTFFAELVTAIQVNLTFKVASQKCSNLVQVIGIWKRLTPVNCIARSGVCVQLNFVIIRFVHL